VGSGKSSSNSPIKKIWGASVGITTLLLLFLPDLYAFAGAMTAIAAATASTFYLHRTPLKLENRELRKELDELKHAVANLQIRSADDDLGRKIDSLDNDRERIRGRNS